MARKKCLPVWHTKFAELGGSNRQKIRSGCSLLNGNINCTPESMRQKAESQLQRPIPLTVYTLARYISSEVGSGTPEEKVAVAKAAVNRAKMWRLKDVNALLLYRQKESHPNYGWYGPIHDASMGAPYGRWASTRQDPGLDDILIAEFVLSGRSKGFLDTVVDQMGPGITSSHHPSGWALKSIDNHADRHLYWVGPAPGVDPWHTFLYEFRPGVDANSLLGKQLISRAKSALQTKQPSWQDLPICSSRAWLPITLFIISAGAGYLIYKKVKIDA